MKLTSKNWIRAHIPNIPIVVNALTKLKIRMIERYSLPEDKIAAGERSAAEKAEIVNAWKEKWPDYAAKIRKETDAYFTKIPELIEDKDEEAIRTDILFNAFAYGFKPDEHFSYHLEGKTREEKNEYISDRDREIYTYLLNNILDMGMFFDKYRVFPSK